jgi:predicted nucleic acid-binding protein
LIYVDTSAALKLVWSERESAAVTALLNIRTDLVSSALLAVEARRGAIRNDVRALPRVDLMLSQFTLLAISEAIIESASRLPDPMLPSLDAIHLATALLVREDIDALVSYDDRLLASAAAHGISTASPA